MKGRKMQIPSRVGLWDKMYEGTPERHLYDDITTAAVAGGFLNHPDIRTIEDWGCGFGGFIAFIGSHQQYIGIDGSNTIYAHKIADLETYTSNPDGLHMRAILEHNPNWESILDNAVKSFCKRMVLSIFTPFQPETRVLTRYENFLNTGVDMVDIGFARKDIVSKFSGIKWYSIENIKTATQYQYEHMFFLER